MLFVGYILMQVPSNLFLNKIGRPSMYLTGCMAIWVSSDATHERGNALRPIEHRGFYVHAPVPPITMGVS